MTERFTGSALTTFVARMSLLFLAATSLNNRQRVVTAFVGSFSVSPKSTIRHTAITSKLTTSSSNWKSTTISTTTAPFPLLSSSRGESCRLFSTTTSIEINEQIKAKGDEIRQLKADGIDKEALAPHIGELKALKAQLPIDEPTTTSIEDINEKIKAKGDEIRQLKADGIDKEALAPHIGELKALKAQLPVDESSKAEAKPVQKKTIEKKQQNNSNNKKKPPVEETMTESEIKLNRLAKVESMREVNVEPFEYTFDASTSAAQLAADYTDKLEHGEEDEESDVAVAGRIMTRRVFGKLAFFTLQDESGTIQLQFDKNRLGDTFQVGKVAVLICSIVWFYFILLCFCTTSRPTVGNILRLLSHFFVLLMKNYTGHQGLDRWRRHHRCERYRTTN
ncbi:MAG: hypothetical protein ACI8RD_010458 [Bacillariaceae sp.]|jgi:hypothetical protein